MRKDYHRIATDLVEGIESEISGIKDLVEGIKEVADEGTEEEVKDQIDYVISNIEELLKRF